MKEKDKYTKWLFTIDITLLNHGVAEAAVMHIMKNNDMPNCKIRHDREKLIVRCQRKDYLEYRTKWEYYLTYSILPHYAEHLKDINEPWKTKQPKMQRYKPDKETCDHLYAAIVHPETDTITAYKCINCGHKREVL